MIGLILNLPAEFFEKANSHVGIYRFNEKGSALEGEKLADMASKIPF